MPNPSPSLKGRDVWRRSHVGIAAHYEQVDGGNQGAISEAIAMQCLCKHLKNAVQAEPHFCLWAYLNAVIYFLAAVYSTNLSRFISSATKDNAYFYALD